MQEKTIRQVSLILTVLGLIFLFFSAEEVQLKPENRLENIPLEKTVKVSGIITQLRAQDKATFLEVEGEVSEKMSIVLFSPEETPLKEGDYVEITGTVEEYRGKKEVIAREVKLK